MGLVIVVMYYIGMVVVCFVLFVGFEYMFNLDNQVNLFVIGVFFIIIMIICLVVVVDLLLCYCRLYQIVIDNEK